MTLKQAIGCLTLAALAALSFAQSGPYSISVIQHPEVVKDLGLTNWQVTRIANLRTQHGPRPEIHIPVAAHGFDELMAQSRARTERFVAALTPHQKERLAQISLQVQ